MKNLAFLQVTARAKSAIVESGQPVELEIAVENLGEEAVEIPFASGQKWDFKASSKAENGAIWSYGMNRRFIQSQSTHRLEAGEILRFAAVWKDAPVGVYEIEAEITVDGGLRAPRFQIVVR